MSRLDELLDKNEAWASRIEAEDPTFFQRLSTDLLLFPAQLCGDAAGGFHALLGGNLPQRAMEQETERR